MLTGALVLAAVWVFLLRYVPTRAYIVPGSTGSLPLAVFPIRSRLLGRFRSQGRRRAGLPAGIRLRRRMGSGRPDAGPVDSHHGRHPQGRARVAVAPDPAFRAQRRVPRPRRYLRCHARAAGGARGRTAEVRRQCLPRAAHPAGDHAGTTGCRPQRSEPRPGEARRAPPRRQRPGDRPHRGAAFAKPGRPASLYQGIRRFVALGGGSRGNAPALRGEARRHHRVPGGHHPRLRLSRSPPSDDHKPAAQRDRPQPPRPRQRAGQHLQRPRSGHAHGREHRRGAQSGAGLDPHRTVPARRRAHKRRARRGRPRPGHRQEHCRGKRRNPNPRPRPAAGSASPCSCPPRRPRADPWRSPH